MLVQLVRETDGRWIGEVLQPPGVVVYGLTYTEARTKATSLALRVLADRVEAKAIPADMLADTLALGLRLMAEQLEDEEPDATAVDRTPSRDLTAWPATTTAGVRAALIRGGWAIEDRNGYSLLTRSRAWRATGGLVFAFGGDELLGPRVLQRVGRHTGLLPENLPSSAEALQARYGIAAGD
jgi:hypothetical protein